VAGSNGEKRGSKLSSKKGERLLLLPLAATPLALLVFYILSKYGRKGKRVAIVSLTLRLEMSKKTYLIEIA